MQRKTFNFFADCGHLKEVSGLFIALLLIRGGGDRDNGKLKGHSPSRQPLSELHFKTKEVYCERERDWAPSTTQILESRKNPVIMIILN